MTRSEQIEAAAREVWESIPGTYDPEDPTVQRHARALNKLGTTLALPADAETGLNEMRKQCDCWHEKSESQMELLAEARQQGNWPKCATCERPATCLGVYEDQNDPPRFGCDTCCGHGNEDGTCFRMPGALAPGAADTRGSER